MGHQAERLYVEEVFGREICCLRSYLSLLQTASTETEHMSDNSPLEGMLLGARCKPLFNLWYSNDALLFVRCNVR